MASTATYEPQEHQLIVSIEDNSMMKELQRAIKMMRGVTKVTIPRKRRMSDYERSLREVELGMVNSYDSVDDFFEKKGL
jgi:hypothetical protein